MSHADPFRKVYSGEPFGMSAVAYNAFVDAARAHTQQQQVFGSPRRSESPLQAQVLVRNDTGEPRDRYSVLGIAGPLIDPSDNLPEFQRILGVRGVTPASEHVGRFVILLEPLGAGSIGRACIDGVCPVEVEMAAETDGYADVTPGVVARLRSAETGAARLLWVQPVEERDNPAIAWTLIRIGGGGGGGGGTAELTLVVVSRHGDPDETDSDRINTHWGRPIYPLDHVRYCPGLPSAEIEFAAAQGRGWFHVGQVVPVFSVAGQYRAVCTGFLGVVTGVARVGGGDVGPGCVEVTPVDGDPAGWPATYNDYLTGTNGRLLFDGIDDRPNGVVQQVATFPGSMLEYGELVWCQYVGLPGRHWIAWNMLDITGPIGASDYGAYEPPDTDICQVPDPDLGQDPPNDDELGTTHQADEGLITEKKALSITIEPSGGGTVTRVPDLPCYVPQTSVQLHAVPNPGYVFVEWTGDLVSSDPDEEIVMDDDKDITATFALEE